MTARPLRCPVCGQTIDPLKLDCEACRRPPLSPAIREEARELTLAFCRAHARDPWLRSAGLLSYSLRSRQRGFLEDPRHAFTRAALELLFRIARMAGPDHAAPLLELVIQEWVAGEEPVLGRALEQMWKHRRESLQAITEETDREAWLERLD